jgi:hypothetical protein
MVIFASAECDGPVRTHETRIEEAGEPPTEVGLLLCVLGRATSLARLEGWRVFRDVGSHPGPE